MPDELKCKSCGEASPLDFDLCWNCGKSLATAERVESEGEDENSAHRDDAESWVEVYRAANAIQAHVVATALESAGIRVFIDGEALTAAIGILPPGWNTSPRVLVAETDVEDARRIIAESERGSMSADEIEEDDTNEKDAES